MKIKDIIATAKELENYYDQFPDWYWKSGLHDALILSVSEKELVPDYKDKRPKWNCLEILLDSKNAIYENDVKKICLYNYKIKTPDIDINKIEKTWWISDTLKQLKNQNYLLEIQFESAEGDRKEFVVSFEFPQVERE